MAGEAPVHVVAGQFGPKSGEALLTGRGIPVEPQMPPGVLTELKQCLERQSKDPAAWKETLFRVREHLPYQTGNFQRAKEKFLHNSLGEDMTQSKKDGLITDDFITQADDRYKKLEEANAIFSDLDKGFKSLSDDRQTEIVEFLTPYYKRTPLGEKLAASKVPEETLQQNVRDLLNKGLHPEDRRAMQEAYKQWSEEANKDIDPLQEQVKATKAGLKNIEDEIAKSEKKRKSLKKDISNNEKEYEDYKDGGKYSPEEIQKLKDADGENKAIILRYPTEITAIDLELQNLTRLEAEILEAGGNANAAQVYSRVRNAGGQLAVALQQIASDERAFNLDHIRPRITKVKSNQTSINSKYNQAAKDHERLQELEGKRDKLETSIKKDKKEREQEKDRQNEWKEQQAKEKQHLADLMKQFQLFETGLTDTLYEQTIDDIMQRYVSRHGTIALDNIEKAMSATSEERKLRIRQYANDQFLDVRGTLKERAGKKVGRVVAHNIGHFLDYMQGNVDRTTTTPGTIEQWLQNRVEGKTLTVHWRENELNGFYLNNILRPGANFENIDPWIQKALGTKKGVSMSKPDWKAIPEEEKMQLRSMVVLEHIAMRYNATGEMPTLLEQRILVSQPWSNELIKAGVIGNPEFVEQMQENVPGVTPEAIKNNDPGALGKVREAATTNRVMGLVLLGLSATSAASALTKEEKQQPT